MISTKLTLALGFTVALAGCSGDEPDTEVVTAEVASWQASNISYVPSSGLTSTNVQGALDQAAARVSTLEATAAVPGPVGPAGPAGPAGAAGADGAAGPPGVSGVAGWVSVGSFAFGDVTASSPNITQAANVAVATGNPGVLCFYNLPFTVRGMIATPEGQYGLAQYNLISVTARANSVAAGCPTGSPDFHDVAFVTGWYSVDGFNGGPRAAHGEGVTVLFF